MLQSSTSAANHRRLRSDDAFLGAATRVSPDERSAAAGIVTDLLGGGRSRTLRPECSDSSLTAICGGPFEKEYDGDNIGLEGRATLTYPEKDGVVGVDGGNGDRGAMMPSDSRRR